VAIDYRLLAVFLIICQDAALAYGQVVDVAIESADWYVIYHIDDDGPGECSGVGLWICYAILNNLGRPGPCSTRATCSR